MIIAKNKIRGELYIQGHNAKRFFAQLYDQRAAVESELGYPLQWEELREGQDSRVARYLENVDP